MVLTRSPSTVLMLALELYVSWGTLLFYDYFRMILPLLVCLVAGRPQCSADVGASHWLWPAAYAWPVPPSRFPPPPLTSATITHQHTSCTHTTLTYHFTILLRHVDAGDPNAQLLLELSEGFGRLLMHGLAQFHPPASSLHPAHKCYSHISNTLYTHITVLHAILPTNAPSFTTQQIPTPTPVHVCSVCRKTPRSAAVGAASQFWAAADAWPGPTPPTCPFSNPLHKCYSYTPSHHVHTHHCLT